jgi:hypothetical protein
VLRYLGERRCAKRRERGEAHERRKRKKEKRRWKLLISYKRADSLLLPAQHPPDVFDSRYCGAHTHTVKKEGKFTTKKASLCVHGLPTATACCWTRPAWTRPFSDTATIRFEFYLYTRFFLLKFSEKKKIFFFWFLFQIGSFFPPNRIPAFCTYILPSFLCSSHTKADPACICIQTTHTTIFAI